MYCLDLYILSFCRWWEKDGLVDDTVAPVVIDWGSDSDSGSDNDDGGATVDSVEPDQRCAECQLPIESTYNVSICINFYT